jgi:hypothetical protein
MVMSPVIDVLPQHNISLDRLVRALCEIHLEVVKMLYRPAPVRFCCAAAAQDFHSGCIVG